MRIGTYYRYELLKKLGIFNKVSKSAQILDIGGFDGFTLSKLKTSKKVLIDPDAKKSFPEIDYFKKDFFSYQFKNKKFDFILSLDVLEHLPKEKEEEYFTKIYSLLKRGGTGIITTPSNNIKIFPNFLRNWVSKKWDHTKCIGYSKDKIKNLIRKAKIKKYKIWAYESRNYLNSYLLIRFLQMILPEKVLERVLLKIANRDAKLNIKESSGYYLIKIEK